MKKSTAAALVGTLGLVGFGITAGWWPLFFLFVAMWGNNLSVAAKQESKP